MQFEPCVDARHMEAMVALSFGRERKTFFLTPLLVAAEGETEVVETAPAGDDDETENADESTEEGAAILGKQSVVMSTSESHQ
ncbi:XPG-like endonuclease [Sesbania bispinosa]|nr:XPG-like endonuclease [Sesbania bispinosa]